MAYFARIEENVVIAIHVVADSIVEDGGESAGQELLEQLHGGEYLLASPDGSLRFNRPNVGYTYDEDRDAFIPPKPSEDATLDETTCTWIVPEPSV